MDDLGYFIDLDYFSVFEEKFINQFVVVIINTGSDAGSIILESYNCG
jgi:hypothetical protein